MVHLRKFLQHPAGRATGIIFALCGFIFGTWASLIPFVKDTFQLDEAQLGLLLLSMPVGTLIANPLSVLIIARWGAIRTSLISIVLMAIAFTFPVIMPNLLLVSVGLVFAGTTFAVVNVAMNTCASYLEEESGLRLMSACHGMWSLGAMGGALLSGFGVFIFHFLEKTGMNPHSTYAGVVVVFTIGITWRIKRDLEQIHKDWVAGEQLPLSGLAMFKPNRILWMLISIILCTYLTEGTIADWSAVYMRDVIKAPEIIVGWGFGLYALFMAGGRFIGDELIARFGNMNVLKFGGQLVVLGLLIIIFSTRSYMAIPGFMLTGLGISVASPILYAAAARVQGMPPGAGLATLNSFGMVAFLGGPVFVGFIAKAINLRIAFAFVAIAALLWVIQTVIITKKKITA